MDTVLDTLIFVYGKDNKMIAIREILGERGNVPTEMKKVAKEFKNAYLLKAENSIDKVTYNLKKKEFTFNVM